MLFTQHGPEEASALSVILARHWASKICSPNKATSQFSRNFALLVALALLLALPPCCHDPSILRNASNLSTIFWFHSVCASVSMFTINTDNCVVLFLFLFLPCTYRGLCVHRSGLQCARTGSAGLAPDPSSAGNGVWGSWPQNTNLAI